MWLGWTDPEQGGPLEGVTSGRIERGIERIIRKRENFVKMAGVDTPVNTQKVPIRRRSLIEVGGEGGSGGGDLPGVPKGPQGRGREIGGKTESFCHKSGNF